MKNIKASFLLQCVFIITLVFSASANANPASSKLVKQGYADLKALNFKSALKKFNAAAKADPSDRSAVFMQGAALNRLGKHARANAKLKTIARASGKVTLIDFELGWSYLGMGQYQNAIKHLTKFEKSTPGNGQTSEFLGRAWLGLGKLDKAEANLNTALERNPRLAGTVHLYLAEIATRRHDADEASEQLNAMMREAPGAPQSRVLRRHIMAAAPKKRVKGKRRQRPTKPWTLDASLSFGSNDNALFLGDRIPLPVGVTQRTSAFARVTLDGRYRWHVRGDDTVTAGYIMFTDMFVDTENISSLDQYFFGEYRHNYNDKISVAFRLSDEYTIVDSGELRNQVALRPSMLYRHNSWGVIELAYSYANNDYLFTPIIPAQNRDSDDHLFSISEYFSVPGTQLKGHAGYTFVTSDATGADFDLDSHQLSIGLSHPVADTGFFVEGSYTYRMDNYDNNNSLSALLPAAQFSRDDDIDYWQFRLSKRFNKILGFFIEYTRVDNRSNIPFYDADQSTVNAGWTASF